MPKCLKDFLKNLDSADAVKLWDYIDGEPDLAIEMIETIADYHQGVVMDLAVMPMYYNG